MFKIRGIDGKEYGPVTADQVRDWIQQRRANAQTLVQTDGSAEWKPLSGFPEFAESLAAVPTPTSPPDANGLRSAPLGASPSFNPSKPRVNPLCITSLVLGILSLLCCGLGGAFFGLLALIFGGIGISKIKKSPEPMGGKGLAIAGIVMGGIGLVLGISLGIYLMNGGLEKFLEQLKK